MKKIHIIFVLLCFYMSISLSNPLLDSSYTLEMLEKMLPENKDIQLAEFQHQIQIYEKKKVDGINFGTIDFTLQGMRTNSSGIIFATKMNEQNIQMTDLSPDALNHPTARNIYDSKVTYIFPLYSGGKITAYQEIANTLEHISHMSKKQMELEKRALLRQTFYKIILIEKLINHITIIKENTIFMKNSISSLKNEGYATKTDILQIEARVEEINNLLYELNTNKELAFHLLRYLTASDVSKISEPLEKVTFKNIENDQILKNNYVIEQAQQAINMQEQQVTIAKADLYPQVGLNLEYGTSDKKIFNNYSEHDYYLVGAGFKLNLFNGGITKNNIESAQTGLLQRKTALSKTQEEIILQADELRTKIKNLDSRLTALTKESNYKEQVFISYKESYKEQHSSMLDILTYQSKYIETLIAIEKVENDKYEAIFKFETLTNGE